jgi:hypothetical protein
MSPQNSTSLDYEPIQQTQSVEYILETETQGDLPDTQESVFLEQVTDIFIYDDLEDTDEEYDPATHVAHDECVKCGNIAAHFPADFPQRQKLRLCASCVHYEQNYKRKRLDDHGDARNQNVTHGGATQVVPSGRVDAFENEQTGQKLGDFFTISGAQKTNSKFRELDDTNAIPPPGRGNPDETPEEEEKEIKKVEVVRGKFAREKLPAFTCEQCEKFYTAIGRPVPEGKPGEACAHCPGSNRMNDWSRHRAKWAPPPDPVGFWDLDLTPAERR